MRVEGSRLPVTDSGIEALFERSVLSSKSNAPEAPPAYRMATNNEVWPPVRDIRIVDVPQDAKDKEGATGESLAFKTSEGGEITVVRREDNPGLFDYIESVSKMPEGTRTYLGVEDEAVKILSGDDTIKLGDIKSLAELKSDGQPTVITAFMKDGTTVDITRELTPDMFDKAAARYNSQAKGYELVTDEKAISKEDLGKSVIGPPDETTGLIELQLANGDKRQISADTTPELFASASTKYDEFTEGSRSTAVDDARKEGALPTASELNIGGLKTSEKDDKGNPLSVNDLAWKNTIAKWKEGIDKGDIKPDDDRAKLYRALQAQAIAEDGTNMAVLDISSGWNVQQALGKDYENILDKDKLEAAVPDLLASKAVSEDLVAARKEALGKVDGGDAAFKKLEEMAFSAEYMTYLKALKDDGKDQVAEDDIAATYEALVSIDPAKADQFAQNAQMDSLTMELNDLVGDTSKINDENLTLATQDIGKMLLTLMKKAGLDIGRRLAECEKFIQEMIGDKKTAKEFGKAMQELGAIYSDKGEVTQKDLDKLLGSGKYTALAEMPDGSALKTFSVLTKEGIIGSLGGTISLVSGIYQVASKGGKIGDTTEERLSVAKDFVGFIGAGKHFADLANDIIGKENKSIIEFNKKIDADNPTMSEEDRNKLKKDPKKPLLGLGSTLDDLVRKPSGTTGGGMTFTDDIGREFNAHLEEVISGSKKEEFYQKRFEEVGLNQADSDAVKKGMEKGFIARPGVDAPTWQKGVSGALLILSAGADTFTGVADAVIGGLTIKKGVDSNDNNAIAKGALQLASGTFGTAGGLASFAGLSKGLGFLKAVAGPAFVVSAILTIATLIPDIINDIKNTDKITGYQKDMLDLFTQLDKDGMLKGDGLKAYEFLNEYMEQYGQRDAPEGEGILAYRKEEYEFWLREGHLPEEGFDDVKHDDYKGDGANLDTQMESSNYG